MVDRRRDRTESHRGAFGEFGGESTGLLERAFREQIVIVGVALDGTPAGAIDDELDELALLVDTAGADVLDRIVQRREAPDPATFVGRGKAAELRAVSDAVDADTVVFDAELTPAQQHNLERILGRTALDRTAVILDIFAQHAHSSAGKVQVELAQLRYRLPRLRGRGRALSQQAGGIGTRGPGETQLEVDRRRLVRRIHKLEDDLRRIERTRRTQSRARRRGRVPTVALVGYTNSGKSTLLNRLTSAGVVAADQLFATVDPTTRRFELPGGETVLVTDTVGFVRKLPHALVESFRSTLEVVAEADLLIHVVDGSAADPEEQMSAVRGVLGEIGAGAVAELVAVNKADLGSGASRVAARLEGAVAVSARTGAGIEALVDAMSDRLRADTEVVELAVPFARGDVLAALHRDGEVLSAEHGEGATRVVARLDERARARFAEFAVGERPDR